MNHALQQYRQYLRDKKVLIYGFGLQGGGLSAALFFAPYVKKLTITDLKTKDQIEPLLTPLRQYQIQGTFGKHDMEDFKAADIIVVNQDIFNKDPDSKFLQASYDMNKKLETEIGLFFTFCQCPIIGITGSRGKTTTTTLIHRILAEAGKKVLLGGNIPDSMTLARVEETEHLDYAVLELSNYQLHGLGWYKKSPAISVVTSISYDHLASYARFEDYLEDKKEIFRHQKESDYLILNRDLKTVFKTSETQAQVRWFSHEDLPTDWTLHIKGDHNRDNVAAAVAVAELVGVENERIRSSVENFEGVPFRLQEVGEVKGVKIINDTTATTPTAAVAALRSFDTGKIIWLAGGNTKKLPVKELAETAAGRVKKIVLINGTGTDELEKVLSEMCQDWKSIFAGRYSDLESAFNAAVHYAQPGNIILFSPGFTSFGMFQNEFDRGRQFNELVEILKNKGSLPDN